MSILVPMWRAQSSQNKSWPTDKGDLCRQYEGGMEPQTIFLGADGNGAFGYKNMKCTDPGG